MGKNILVSILSFILVGTISSFAESVIPPPVKEGSLVLDPLNLNSSSIPAPTVPEKNTPDEEIFVDVAPYFLIKPRPKRKKAKPQVRLFVPKESQDSETLFNSNNLFDSYKTGDGRLTEIVVSKFLSDLNFALNKKNSIDVSIFYDKKAELEIIYKSFPRDKNTIIDVTTYQEILETNWEKEPSLNYEMKDRTINFSEDGQLAFVTQLLLEHTINKKDDNKSTVGIKNYITIQLFGEKPQIVRDIGVIGGSF